MKCNKCGLRPAVLAFAVAATILLEGCGNGGAEKNRGQSVARVDGYELTVHQLNSELASLPQTAANEATLKSQALQSLINHRVLVSEAERTKIDHDPDVMQAIERQKEQILIQALIQRKAAAGQKPSESEVKAYYHANPALFANRKTYEMRHAVISADSATPALTDYVDSGHSLDEVIAWLEKNDVQFSAASAPRSSADLPQQVVEKLGSIENGTPFILKDSQRVVIASLHPIKETPVTEEKARPQIEQFLINTRLRDVAKAELLRLRTAARIEYLDPAIAPVQSGSNKLADNGAEAGAKPNDAISKGLSGLK